MSNEDLGYYCGPCTRFHTEACPIEVRRLARIAAIEECARACDAREHGHMEAAGHLSRAQNRYSNRCIDLSHEANYCARAIRDLLKENV